MKTSTKVKAALRIIGDKFIFESNNKKNRTIFKNALKTKLREMSVEFIKVIVETNVGHNLCCQVHFKNSPKRLPHSIHIIDCTICPCLTK
jgi:hypothetical protein